MWILSKVNHVNLHSTSEIIRCYTGSLSCTVHYTAHFYYAVEFIYHPKSTKDKIIRVGWEQTACNYTDLCSIWPPVFHDIANFYK